MYQENETPKDKSTAERQIGFVRRVLSLVAAGPVITAAFASLPARYPMPDKALAAGFRAGAE